MVSLMGSETTEIDMKPGSEITVIMMAGLQGAGKLLLQQSLQVSSGKGKKTSLSCL